MSTTDDRLAEIQQRMTDPMWVFADRKLISDVPWLLAELVSLRGQLEAATEGRSDEDGVVFMPAGEAVGTGTEWCVFAGGPDPENCAIMRVADAQDEADDFAQWTTGGRVAYRKVDYGPWIVMPVEPEQEPSR